MSSTARDESWRGKIGRLEQEDLDAFLAEGHIARLACLDDAGWPYVVPVWHEWDGHGFWLIPRMKSAWATFLRSAPRCAITVDETGTLRKVIAQGEAKLVEEPNVGGRWVEIAERMSVRYLGENGPKYLEPTLDRKRWLFYIEPVRLWTWQGVEWARRYKLE
jgi:nitroimidazol reductase NimA-like FMN-containing flavoprotein (pyridoxamine 5'-phosphate oxidase superfamily)